jgi:hypothetical protein
MTINAQIIDQQVSIIRDLIRDRARDELNIRDEEKLRSLAFVHLCVKKMLDLSDDDAFECLTEGGHDFSVDAIHCSEEYDREFTISIFQGKYKRDFDGTSTFPETAIDKLIRTAQNIADPQSPLQEVNTRLKIRVEEIRSLIRDGSIPQVHLFACNNGLKWNQAAEEAIKRANFDNQVTWEHVNHDRLITIFQVPRRVDDTLKLIGNAIIEDLNFSRVFVGKIAVTEIAALIERNGDRLLERNVRKYLGLQGNRVNKAIRDTLLGSDRNKFYFYNNGITATCDKFTYNTLQTRDYQVRVENLQIINGGQTCLTIFKTLEEYANNIAPQDAYVLIRLYELPSENADLVKNITLATNSQNPVDLRDLMANDEVQRRLELDIKQLGFSYRRKRIDTLAKPTDITSGVAAEAVLSVWRKKPHKAKFYSREHFGNLYYEIFSNDLNGTQVIIATLLYRIAENKRRRSLSENPAFIRYGSCFIAMQMGKYLLKDLEIDLTGLTHQTYIAAKNLHDQNGEYYFEQGMVDVGDALKALYGGTDVSLQRQSATFRRGDLIDTLNEMTLRERPSVNAAITTK